MSVSQLSLLPVTVKPVSGGNRASTIIPIAHCTVPRLMCDKREEERIFYPIDVIQFGVLKNWRRLHGNQRLLSYM